MEIFKATQYDTSIIELTSSSDIERLVQCIEKEENVIIQVEQDEKIKSELVITEDLFTKVKDGSLVIKSLQKV